MTTTHKPQPQYLQEPSAEPDWAAFDEFVAPQPAEPVPESAGVLRTTGDMAIKGAQGIVGLGQAVVGLGSLATGGLVGKGMRKIGYDPNATKEWMGEHLSDAQKASDAAVQKEDTLLGAAGAMLTHPRALAGSIVESLPGMIAGMGATAAVARSIGAKAAAAYGGMSTEAGALAAKKAIEQSSGRLLAVSAGTEGAQSGGQIADDAQAAGRTYGQYAPAAIGAGLGTAAIGLGAGKLMGDAATDFAAGTRTLKGGKMAKVGKELVSEGLLEEMPQSAQEQMFTNVAQGEKDLGKGVANAAGMGLVTGATMGAGMGLLHGNHDAPPPPPLPDTGPLSRAANAANAAKAAEQAAQAAENPATPAATTAADAGPSIAEIDARMAELVAIGRGMGVSRTVDAEGNDVHVPAVPARPLTVDEKAEYNSLKQARVARTTLPPEQQAQFDAMLAEEQAQKDQKFKAALQVAEDNRVAMEQAAKQKRDAAELAQIEQMVQTDEQIRQQAELERQQQDLQEVNARIERDDLARSQANRAALRDEVLANESIPPDAKKPAFAAALKRAGYRVPELNEIDHQEIDDAIKASEPLPSLPNELVDAVPERKPSEPVASAAPNTQAVDEAIAAGMRLKNASGNVLHKPGSAKIFRLSTAQRAYYDQTHAGKELAQLPSAPNELVDVVPERKPATPVPSAPNTQAVDAAIAAGMRLKTANGNVLQKPGSTKIFRLSTAQRAYYDQVAAAQATTSTAPVQADIAGAATTAPGPAVTAQPESPAGETVPAASATPAQQLDLTSAQPSLSEPAQTPSAPAAPVTPLDLAAHAAATSPTNDLAQPTQAQKEAGNYKVGRVRLYGMDLSIENPAGSVRAGVDKAGQPWENTIQHHYGYIRGTVGADKDHIDTFIGPNHDSDKVFVVDQVDPETGKFDEHKVMMGFDSLDQARDAYQANYAPNWTGGRNVSETTVAGFKGWLAGGKTKKPFAKLSPAPAPAAAPIVPAAQAPAVPEATATPAYPVTLYTGAGGAVLDLEAMYRRNLADPKVVGADVLGDDIAGMLADDKLRKAKAAFDASGNYIGKYKFQVMPARSGGRSYVFNDLEDAKKHADTYGQRDEDAPKAEPRKRIGKREDGQLLFENAVGLRSYTRSGFKYAEEPGQPRADDFKTAEELAAPETPASQELQAQPVLNTQVQPVLNTQAEPVLTKQELNKLLVKEMSDAQLQQASTLFADSPRAAKVAKEIAKRAASTPAAEPRMPASPLADASVSAPPATTIAVPAAPAAAVAPTAHFAATPANKPLDIKTYTAQEAQDEWQSARPAKRQMIMARVDRRDLAAKSWEDLASGERTLVHQALDQEFESPIWYINNEGKQISKGTMPAVVEKSAAQVADEQGAAQWADMPPAARHRALTDNGIGKDAEQAQHVNWEQLGTQLRAKLAESLKPKAATPAPAGGQFAQNKLFTADAVEKARARLKSKLGVANAGIDPELMMDGITIAGAYVESGVRLFSAFSKAMIDDLGESIRPYLRSFYEGVRHYPGLDTAGMNTSAEIDAMEQAGTAPHTQALTAKDDAIGETVKVTPKPKRSTDTHLRDDWGVSHIDGWAEQPGGKNEQTDYGLRGGLKDAFLADAQAYLRKVSAELQAQGFTTYRDAKGKPLKAVRINESGVAGSGDVSLSLLHPEKNHGIYLHIGDTAIRGMVPNTKSGVALMMRVGSQADHTGTKDGNRWMPVNLSAVELAEQAAKAVHAKAVRSEPLAKPVTINDTQPTPAQAVTKEQHHDSTPAASAPAIDSPVAEGQPASRDAVVRGAGTARARNGRDDAGNVREPRGRDQGQDDARQDLGHERGADAVSDRTADPVGRSDERVSADFRPGPGGLTREGSWFDTAKRNVDLIDLARQIESENRSATPAEQAQLAKYVGFGASAIRNKLFPLPSGYAKQQEPGRLIWPNLISEDSWRDLAKRMEALPAAWQRSVLQSSQYAHYTSEGIIRSTWNGMQRLGFTGGKVFEPGMGIGSFSMLMPENVRATSRYTGVEFDGPTALIARLLSPEQNMLHDDFIKRKFPKDYFDVAIGNPPFSQTQIFADPDYQKHGFMLHDFFFAKSIDRVRPGGLLAFVTSKGTMDKQTDKARKYLAARADLVGAIRLPSTAFEDNAGTSVVTDVIFLRKRKDGEAPAGQAWAKVATIDTVDGPVVVNEYFANNPEMVLGQNRISGNTDDNGRRINSNGRGGEQYTVVSYDKTPADLDAKFAAAVERLPANVYSVLSQSGDSVHRETAKVDFDPSVKREGVVYLGNDGDVMRVENGVGVPLASGMKMTEADKKWFAGYVGMRDLVNEARLAQATDGSWEKSLKKLNKAYDAFRAEHGPLNDFRVQVRKTTDEQGKVVETESRIFKNRRRFREDYDAAILTQLETINEAGEIVKSPFLMGRTIGKPVSREVKTIGDALAVSLDETGRLNLEDVGRRIGMSREETIEALGNQAYQTPAGEWQLADEYLSGDVVTKLEEAEQAARLDRNLARNVEALKAAQPEKLGPSQISAKLGASWIPLDHVNAFAHEIEAGAVTFDPQTETWQVDGGNSRSERRAGAEYGTAARSPSELLESALNSRPVKITSKIDGKVVTDQEATTAANEMLKKIKDKFKGWVWTDTERASELVENYNRRYNNIAPRRFDGSHLTLPGVSMRYNLHPHQKRAIWRQVQTGDTYLAHAVGAGKTIEMIAGGMEQKRLGLIKKPTYVVPNHMLEQFANEFMELYPLANIMVADDENFTAERRKAFIANATMNNPDAIIITHDAFQRIGVKEESVAPIRDELLADLEIQLAETATDSGARVRRSQLEQQIEAVTQRFDRIINAGGKDSTLKFEDIGIDFVYADEAHVFRKLDFHTSQQIKGIDPNGSKRALDMYVKTRWLQRQRPGRAMVFASGTPVTNTMGELYTIMRFFAPEEMDRAGIASFDAWSRLFGEVAPALEPNAAGRYELIERFAKFDNVPELMSRVRQFMDVLTSEHLGALVKRPDLIGGKPHLEIVAPSEGLEHYMSNVLGPRIEKSKRWKPSKEQPSNPDPIVAIITDGRFAAIDPRFFSGQLGEEGSIITKMADNVVAEYHAGSENVYQDKNGKDEPIKGSTQIVFYNLGFGEQSQKNRGFNSRAAFTNRLTDGGIPRDKIAWFDDANTDAKKEAIFKAMRSGQLRVLIGSAKKMGTGVNVQKRLAKLHYQDPPWFPADVEQPHGRIIRQGNQNGQVAIDWYTTKGTYQSTMWQMVGRKQRFIDQAFSGDATLRSMEDMGEASLFEQAAAVASGDPRAIQLAGLKQEVERFERLQAAHASEQLRVRSALRGAEWEVQSATRRISTYGDAFAVIGQRQFAFTSAEVGGAHFDKVGEFGQAVKSAFNKLAAGAITGKSVHEQQIGSLGKDLTLTVDAETAYGKETGAFTLYVNVGDLPLTVTSAESLGEQVDAVGLGRRIVNQINSIGSDLTAAKKDLASGETDLVRLRKKNGAPFEYQQEMVEKYGDLKRLEEELRLEGMAPAAVPVVIDEDGATAEEAGSPAGEPGDAAGLAFSRSRIDTDDPLVNIFSQIAQDDDAFRLPESSGTTLRAVLGDVSPGLTVDEYQGAGRDEDQQVPVDRVWTITDDARPGLSATVYRNNKNKEIWLDISNWTEGKRGAQVYQAVATFAKNTGNTFIGDPQGLSDKALYRRTEHMISSALRHGTTEHLAPHSRQVDATSTAAGIGVRPMTWQAGEHAQNLREMLVSSYTNISQVFPEINNVSYNFSRARFERTSPVRASAAELRTGEPIAGERADSAGVDAGRARSADGRGAVVDDEGAGKLGRVDATAFTDADFAAAARSVRAAYDARFPSARGAYTPPLGVSDLKRAALVATVLRAEGSAAGRAVLDHVSDRLLQRVSPQLDSLLYSRDAEFFRNDGNFLPELPAGIDAGGAVPIELTGRELLQAKKSTEQLNRQLAKEGLQPVRALRSAPNAQFALARQIGETMGIEVNFVSKHAHFDGVAYKGTAYLADGMRNPELAIAGHETLHALEQSNPELGAKLREQIRSYLADNVVQDRQASEFVASGFQEVSHEQAEAEVIADINGAMWMDPVFWADMAKADRSLFRTVAYKFMELATQAIKSMQGSRFDVAALVKDVAAVRAIMVSTWAEHNAQRDAAASTPGVQRSNAASSVALPRAQWLSNEAIAKEIDNRIGQFAHQPTIRVRDSAFGLLPGVAFDDRVSGAVHEDVIYLFRDALPTLREVQRTLFHEMLHYGLQRFVPKEQYITRMKSLYQRDAYFRSEADRWASGEQGRVAAAYGGQQFAIARGVDEALAQLAEPNAGVYIKNGLRDRAERAVQRWLANLAQFLGMHETAAYWRSIKNEEARSLIQQIFQRIEHDLPPADPWKVNGGPLLRSGDRAKAPATGTNSAAFKAWFGKSKVVDEAGAPLVVYHGSGQGDIHAFEISEDGHYGKGAYFTSDPAMSDHYAARGERKGGNGTVYPVYLSMKRPLTLTDLGDRARWESDIKNGGLAAAVSRLRLAISNARADGVIVEGRNGTREGAVYAVFSPNQIKSAISNNGEYDAANPGILFSRKGLGDALASAAGNIADVRLPANYRIGDLFNASGKISWWHKSIGTMDNLAKRAPAFGRVYEAVQNFIGDVSRYAVVAADLAPRLLPKLENVADIIGKDRKKPLTAADTKAIGAPIFEGTLAWARDEHDKPVRIAVLEAKFEQMTTEQKAQVLLKKGIIDDGQNQAWMRNPLNFYERIINSKFDDTQLKAGIVWSDAELRTMFHLNDDQVAMYREFRDAIDKSLTNLTISEMVKLGGKDAQGMLEQAIATDDLGSAGELLRDHFIALAKLHPEKVDIHLDTAKKIMDLADKGEDLMDRGYAPLSRFGKHTVYVQQDGEQVYFGMFETPYEASKMARDMAAEHPKAEVSQGTISEDAYKLFAGVSPETIELFGSMVGLDDQVDPKQNEVYQTYLKLAKNNRSSMKRLIQRKGIAGFSEDAGRVLAGFIYSNARLTAGNAHLGKIDEAVTEIPKQEGELTDAAMQLREHIRNPEGGGSKLGGLMFAQFLGGSVASAMVNLTQPVAMTLPYLSQWGGIGKAGKRLVAAVSDAAKDVTGDVRLDAAMKWATEEGIVAPQEVHYLQAQAQGKGGLRSGDGTRAGNARAHASNAMAKVSLGWGKLFAMAELANRRITFIAAYRTAVEEGMTNPEKFAQQAVTQTQGMYNAGNKPKWARSTIGGLLMTFKQYSIAYLELLTRMAFAGEPGSKERAAGRRAALYMVAVLFLMGGADGLPFAQDLEDALDGILQRFGYNFSTKRKKQEFLTEVLGQGGADFALKGLSAVPGMPIDVAGRFGMGNLIPGTGLLTKKDSYTRDLGELAGPAGDFVKRAFTGAGKALGGDLVGGALDVSPAAVRNLAKGADMLATGAYRDTRGYTVNETSPSEAVMKMIGFQPNSTADIQGQKGQALDMVSQNRMRSSEIAEHWAQGLATGKASMVQEAREMRDDWNAKNPEAPIRVSLPGIIRRVRAMKQDAIARTQKTAPAALKQAVRTELAATRD